jgi:hypothetical protein
MALDDDVELLLVIVELERIVELLVAPRFRFGT